MPDYLIRPPEFDEAAAVARLIAACDKAITGESHYADELITVRNDWRYPDFDIASDAWVVVDPGEAIVGYEIVFDLGSDQAATCDGFVHPDYMDRGIGTALLQRAIARARAASASRRLHALIYHVEMQAHALLRAAGFELVRGHWQMRITLEQPPAPPEWPAGISVRRFQPGDELAVYETVVTAFADHWGHARNPFDIWQHGTMQRDDFNPELWLLAFAGDELVGVALCYDEEDKGWVRNLGVLRQWRKRGLGMALLRHAFEVFYARGRRTIGLGVDSASLTGATRLYERAGMHIVQEYDTYELAFDESLV